MEVSQQPTFCHLHVHSEYSLEDGAIRIKELVERVKSFGQTAVALTDHANMFAAVDFYSSCVAAGIKPIIGCEVYCEGLPTSREALSTHMAQPGMDAFHLVLLAKSNKGYHALMRVVSSAYLSGTPGELPVVGYEDLITNSEDLIVLSSCLRGEFGRLVAQLAAVARSPEQCLRDGGQEADQKQIVSAILHLAEERKKAFGPDYYVELIDNGLPQQQALLPHIVECAKILELPVVASADAHYLNEDFDEAHAVLTGIKNDLTLKDLRHRRRNVAFHLQTPEEMEHKFSSIPGALSNSLKIAESCNVELEFGKFFLPEFELHGEDINEALKRIAQEGLDERYKAIAVATPDYNRDEYQKRLEYELGVIISMGFPGYFLIVQDFINWAKDNNIPVGPGRGSGAGSLVAYALRITDLDPIPLNLIFERFLNPERISMPDFDVDFCQARRDEVIQYVVRKYGAGNVAQITTFGKMKAKAAIRDVGRVLNLSYTRVDKIAKLIPNELDITLDDALEQEPRLNEEASRDQLVEQLLGISKQIEGLTRHTSIHAAGVVISNGPMENFVPVYKDEAGSLVTQYEMKNAEKVGLVKFDFLGLKTLTVIQKAVEYIHMSGNKDFSIETINLEDKPVYEVVSAGHTCAIFQLESSGMRNLNMKLKPSCFEDIIAVVALFRPGPLGSGMVDDFIERKHGRQAIEYLHPLLEPILKDTYGIILYQEQVQKIAATLASYSLGEADILRRAMGKKKPEEMAKQKARFMEGAKGNSIDPKIADELFELMAKFAAYGFNKSHSAAYGLITYQTAFLKTHYPAEFMAAIMTCDLDNTDKLVRYIQDVKRMGFTLLSPDINRSHLEFRVHSPKTIDFGLAAIKGLGETVIKPIIELRDRQGPFKSLTEIAEKVDLSKVGKKTLELLTEVGAFDSFGYNRLTLVKTVPSIVKHSQEHFANQNTGQRLLFGTPKTKEGVVKAHWEKSLANQTALSSYQHYRMLLTEHKRLGIFLSHHPYTLFLDQCKKYSRINLADIPKHVGAKNLNVAALLLPTNERITKNGKRITYVPLEDHQTRIEGVAFEGVLDEPLPPAFSMVVAEISIQKSFDGQNINIRVESLKSLEQLRQDKTRSIRFSIDGNQLSLDTAEDTLNKLSSLFKSHPGHSDIQVELRYGKVKVELDVDHLMALSPSDRFLEEAEALKGLSISFN